MRTPFAVESLERRTLLAGVTLLTHGFSGGVRGWIGDFVATLDAKLGGVSDYTLTIDENDEGRLVAATFTREEGSPDPDQTPTGEIVVRLNWGNVSEGQYSTGEVAAVAAEFLRSAGLPGGLPLAQLPMHLIGHSRGGSLIAALARELSEAGIWVDQITPLDPHPVDSEDDPFGADFGDAPMLTPEGVIFADNYWRADDNIFDVSGEPLPGAHNVNLTGVVEATLIPPVMAHDLVKAYYYGTLNTSADDLDGDEIDEDWYGGNLPERTETGWVFSRLGGGVRPSGGVGREFSGAAARTAITPQGPQWANIALIAPRDESVSVGEALYVSFVAQDRDGPADVTFFLDRDRNPFNDNVARKLGDRSLRASDEPEGWRIRGNTTGIDPGEYFIYAKVTDPDGHTRYAFGEEPITLTAPSEEQLFATLDDRILTASGTSAVDRFFIEAGGGIIAITLHDFTQTFAIDDVSQVRVFAGEGDDRVVAAAGMPRFYALGELGNDTLIGGNGNDTLTGGASKDLIIGGAGADRLNGSGGHDRIVGGQNDDRLYGGNENDSIEGGHGADRLQGGSGLDTLAGNAGNDRFFARDGLLDRLVGGDGADSAQVDPEDELLDEIENLLA